MQRRKLVREPGDRVALAAPGGVLDQVALARTVPAGVGDHAPHGVELLVAWEDETGRPSALALLLLHLVDELADQVENAVARPSLFPKVVGGVSLSGWRDGRIAGPAAVAAVEWQEAGLATPKAGGDVHQIRVHSEMRETTAVGEERFARIAVAPVLRDRVADILAGERVLEFGGEEGDAVEEERQVHALFRLGAVAELPHDGEEVRRVQPPGLLVEAARRSEVRQLELAARVLDSLAEHVNPDPAIQG